MKVKDSVPRSLRSCVVYKFTCARCNSVYVGKMCRHISTRVREHLFTDKNSHVYKHLQSSKTCTDSCNESCFKVSDSSKTYHQLKVKEPLLILWEGPNLNKLVHHYNFSFLRALRSFAFFVARRRNFLVSATLSILRGPTLNILDILAPSLGPRATST